MRRRASLRRGPRTRLDASVLVEFPDRHQFLNRLQRRLGIASIGLDADPAARCGRQHHQAHNALAIDALAVLLDKDLALEPAHRADKQRSRTGVDTLSVEDGEFPYDVGEEHGAWNRLVAREA